VRCAVVSIVARATPKVAGSDARGLVEQPTLVIAASLRKRWLVLVVTIGFRVIRQSAGS